PARPLRPRRSPLRDKRARRSAARRTAGSWAEQLLELRRPKLGRQLLIGALLRVLVRPPADEAGAVAEAAAGDLVVANLDHQLGLERLPRHRALGVPPARPARRASGEARRLDQLLQ